MTERIADIEACIKTRMAIRNRVVMSTQQCVHSFIYFILQKKTSGRRWLELIKVH